MEMRVRWCCLEDMGAVHAEEQAHAARGSQSSRLVEKSQAWDSLGVLDFLAPEVSLCAEGVDANHHTLDESENKQVLGLVEACDRATKSIEGDCFEDHVTLEECGTSCRLVALVGTCSHCTICAEDYAAMAAKIFLGCVCCLGDTW